MFNKPSSKHQLRAKANTFGIGSGKFILVALATVKTDKKPELRVGVGVEISGSEEYYATLGKDESRIESEIGDECGEQLKLKWELGTKVSDIWLYRNVDFFERQQWLEQHEWFCKRLEAFRRVLKPRITELLGDFY
jgi:hypothetical protein